MFINVMIFMIGLVACPLMAIVYSTMRMLTPIGKSLLTLVMFLGLRYIFIPAWSPDTVFWQYVKAALEVLALHGLAWSPLWREFRSDYSGRRPRGRLLSALLYRCFFVACLYLAFYDVISVWPAFGQFWYWLYVIVVTVVVVVREETMLTCIRSTFLSVHDFLVAILDLCRDEDDDEDDDEDEDEDEDGNDDTSAAARVEKGAKRLSFELIRTFLLSIVWIIVSIVISVYFVCCIVSSGYRHSVNDRVEDVVLVLRGKVAKAMPDISNVTSGVMDVWNKALERDRAILDREHPKTADVRSRAAVKRSLAKLRKMLLPIDSQQVLLNIRRCDIKIASQRVELEKLRERRGLHPEKAESLDAKIADAEAKLGSLEATRAEAMEKTRADLKAIGLDFPEKSPFLMVDIADLVDNAIVAKNAAIVIENLKSAVEAEKGDTVVAKRYYGAYIVLLDVQAECFRQYLAKAATGIWRKGVEEVEKKAEAAMKNNEAKALEDARTEEERIAFRHAAQTNKNTLEAARMYLHLLESHEATIKEKLNAVESRHDVALSFWESVDIAGDFTGHVVADTADFEALLELKLPELSFVDNDALQAEFESITRQLSKEE